MLLKLLLGVDDSHPKTPTCYTFIGNVKVCILAQILVLFLSFFWFLMVPIFVKNSFKYYIVSLWLVTIKIRGHMPYFALKMKKKNDILAPVWHHSWTIFGILWFHKSMFNTICLFCTLFTIKTGWTLYFYRKCKNYVFFALFLAFSVLWFQCLSKSVFNITFFLCSSLP